MSAPLTSKSICVCALLAMPRCAKSSRCSAEDSTLGVPSRFRSLCRRSTSQAPPEVMPASRVEAPMRLRTPRSSSRYSASASSTRLPLPAILSFMEDSSETVQE
ncbi:hypothetical protein D3C71_1970690 [compost metagenome]